MGFIMKSKKLKLQPIIYIFEIWPETAKCLPTSVKECVKQAFIIT